MQEFSLWVGGFWFYLAEVFMQVFSLQVGEFDFALLKCLPYCYGSV